MYKRNLQQSLHFECYIVDALKQGDGFPLLLFNFYLEYAIWKVHENKS
jgi:hypothetical protein